MGRNMNEREIITFLQRLSERVTKPSEIHVLGGSALVLLGGSRPTIDLDFVGDDLNISEFQRMIHLVADEMGVEVEPVSMIQFIPMPKESEERNIRIGQFGNLEVYVLDPYAIAISKLDRGFDSDIEDIVFLIQNGFVAYELLESMMETALQQSGKFDLNPASMRKNIKTVLKRLG